MGRGAPVWLWSPASLLVGPTWSSVPLVVASAKARTRTCNSLTSARPKGRVAGIVTGVGKMSDLVVLDFDGVGTADEVLTEGHRQLVLTPDQGSAPCAPLRAGVR
jgi:hypothetical protein